MSMTLRLQFVLCVCSLIILLMLGVLSFIYTREQRILSDQLEAIGNAAVLSLCSSFYGEAVGYDYLAINETLPKLKEQKLIDYGDVLSDERVLASSEKDRWLKKVAADPSSLRALSVAGPRGSVAGPMEVFRNGGRYVEFVGTIVEGRDRAVLRLGYDRRSRIDAVVAETQRNLLGIFLVAVLIGGGLSFVLAHAVITPIQRLANHVKTLAFDPQSPNIVLHETGAQEIRDLTDSFNYLREKIQAHIDELDEANMALDRKVFELRTMFDVAETMNFKSYSPELLAYIIDTAIRALDAQWGSLWLYDAEQDLLEAKMVRGAGYDRDEIPKPKPGMGIAGMVFADGEPILSNDGVNDPRFHHFAGQEDFERLIKQIVCVPLLVDNEAIGVINVVNKKGENSEGFDDNDLHLLSALASQAARALEHAKLYDLAIRESKTGLFIPRYFQARLQEQITGARRYGHVFSVLITDLDHFKQVNDRFGHLVGDEVLVKTSRFLCESLRDNIDIASRWGGEEFAVILPRTDREGAITFADRYRRRIEQESGDEEQGIPPVTVSAGVATFPIDGTDADSLMKAADTALYRAKSLGRNRVCSASTQS